MARIKKKFNYYRYKVLSGLGTKLVSLGFSVRDKGVSYLLKEYVVD